MSHPLRESQMESETASPGDGSSLLRLPAGAHALAREEHGWSRDREVPLDVFTVLWKQRAVFLPIFALCLVGAIVYLRVATPLYTAVSRIDVAMALPPIAGAAEEANRPDAENFLNSQSQLISSSAVLSRVVERDEIKGMQTFAGDSDLLTSLQKQLVVTPGRRDNLITISLESPSREEATRIVDAVV